MLRLKRCHAYVQWHSFRVFTPLTGTDHIPSKHDRRELLKAQPHMMVKVKASLLQRGIPCEDITDPMELVDVAAAKMQGIQDETKAELIADAATVCTCCCPPPSLNPPPPSSLSFSLSR
jgi:hypothetical protein